MSVKSDECFYICSLADDGKTCTNLVFTVATVDKYAPRKTGVYNISLKKKIPGNKT